MLNPRARSRAATAVALATVTLIAGCSGSAGGPDPARPQSGSAPAPSSTATSPATLESARTSLEERVAVFDGIVTGAVVLVRVGEETAVVTSGRADVRRRTKMSGDLTWPIASITKMMTATLVMQLVEDGRVALDDDVRTWVPELEGVGPVTVEQLLSHRSGLLRDPAFATIRRIGFSHTAGIVRWSGDQGPDYAAGSEGRYSNVGFAALGLLVSRVLDQPLGAVLQRRVFDPAGMEYSTLGARPTIQGYAQKPVRRYYLGYAPGAGSVVSSVADVGAFLHALWAGELLDPRLVADMRESRGPVQVSPFLSLDYGLGVMHKSVSCGDTLGHSGRIGGFTDEAWTLVDGSRSVVVTVNDQDADEVVESIVETALCG